jgi:hypothetical protein
MVSKMSDEEVDVQTYSMDLFNGCLSIVYRHDGNTPDGVLGSLVNRVFLSLMVEVLRSQSHSLSAVLFCFWRGREE